MTATILVVDDHPGIRENVAEILTLAGYNALEARNGKQAIEMAREKTTGPHRVRHHDARARRLRRVAHAPEIP